MAVAGIEAWARCASAGASTRARTATRTCEGRPFAGAGVNLKSVSARPLPARAAASFGSAFAGVKEETGSKLSEIELGRFFVGDPVANAGVSTRPAAASAATILPPLRSATLGTFQLPVEGGYSRSHLKVP